MSEFDDVLNDRMEAERRRVATEAAETRRQQELRVTEKLTLGKRHEGTKIEVIFGEETEFILEFITRMRSANMPGSKRILLDDGYPDNPETYGAKLGSKRNPGRRVRGYKIGRSDISDVYLCEDELLRQEYEDRYDRTRGAGSLLNRNVSTGFVRKFTEKREGTITQYKYVTVERFVTLPIRDVLVEIAFNNLPPPRIPTNSFHLANSSSNMFQFECTQSTVPFYFTSWRIA